MTSRAVLRPFNKNGPGSGERKRRIDKENRSQGTLIGKPQRLEQFSGGNQHKAVPLAHPPRPPPEQLPKPGQKLLSPPGEQSKPLEKILTEQKSEQDFWRLLSGKCTEEQSSGSNKSKIGFPAPPRDFPSPFPLLPKPAPAEASSVSDVEKSLKNLLNIGGNYEQPSVTESSGQYPAPQVQMSDTKAGTELMDIVCRDNKPDSRVFQDQVQLNMNKPPFVPIQVTRKSFKPSTEREDKENMPQNTGGRDRRKAQSTNFR